MHQFQTANMLDRAILSVAPRRGLDRIQAKVRASVLMNYDAAGSGRRVKGWKAPATDADASSLAGRSRLRQLSRDMIRNAPFARRAQSVVTNNVVGNGIIPAVVTKSKAAKAEAEGRILGHLKSSDLDVHGDHNIFGLQSVVANSVFESGEILVMRRMRGANSRLKLPFQVELIEVDHLNPTVAGHGENEVIDGIEYDSWGRVVAYHLYEKHPGSATRKTTLKTNRIPASEILHIRRIDRPGQTRGVPWLAPVMLTLGELRDYQEAQILKQKISALLAGVVQAGEGGAPTGTSGLDALAPGAFVYTQPGETVEFTTPPKVDDYEVVMRLGLMAIAMGLGITYESVAGDLARVNFSSSRVGRLEMDRNIEAWQRRILMDQLCAGIERWSLAAYRLVAKKPAGLALEWTPPVRPLIDPNKEIPAIIKKVKSGLSSLQREQRGMGLDPDTIERERLEDAARSQPPMEDPPPGSKSEKDEPT